MVIANFTCLIVPFDHAFYSFYGYSVCWAVNFHGFTNLEPVWLYHVVKPLPFFGASVSSIMPSSFRPVCLPSLHPSFFIPSSFPASLPSFCLPSGLVQWFCKPLASLVVPFCRSHLISPRWLKSASSFHII